MPNPRVRSKAELVVILTATALLIGAAATALASKEDHESALDDAMLRAKVEMALLGDLGVDGLGVDVHVEKGVVTLSGVVDERETHELAKEVVQSVEGVDEVNDDLRLDKKAYQKKTTMGRSMEEAKAEVSDLMLKSRAYASLLGELGTNALDIDVDVANGKVVLNGKVASKQHAELATKKIESLEGVKDVSNNIQVQG